MRKLLRTRSERAGNGRGLFMAGEELGNGFFGIIRKQSDFKYEKGEWGVTGSVSKLLTNSLPNGVILTTLVPIRPPGCNLSSLLEYFSTRVGGRSGYANPDIVERLIGFWDFKKYRATSPKVMGIWDINTPRNFTLPRPDFLLHTKKSTISKHHANLVYDILDAHTLTH